jgi:ABC-type amino acid transport substrate-binding protein
MGTRMVAAAAAFAGAFLALVAGESAIASAGTLDRIGKEKTVRLAVRPDAPPFSYSGSDGATLGYSVDLCRAVVDKLAEQLKTGPLKIEYVPVTAANRFEAIATGKADLLCEATSVTLSRRETVDFSISTFIDGASLMVRADGPSDVAGLAGKKIGVLAGTTTEAAAQDFLKAANATAEFVSVKTHAEGLAMLDDAKISAYFGDRSILLFLAQGSKVREQLRLADQYLSAEPYALALARGDGEFRLAVDRALSHIYRSGAISAVFDKTFAGKVKPSQTLLTLYMLSALPD